MLMQITDDDKQLMQIARQALTRAYEPIWHTVGAAVRTKSGKVYSGVNVDASTGSGGGTCAEMGALSAAISAGDKNVETIVSIAHQGDRVLPPCGVCRQTLITHAPEAVVILEADGELKKISVRELMPYAYENARDGVMG